MVIPFPPFATACVVLMNDTASFPLSGCGMEEPEGELRGGGGLLGLLTGGGGLWLGGGGP